MSLDAKSILAAKDTSKIEVVNVPEWGGDVYVRVMTGAERDAWEIDAVKDKNIRASLAFICLCDSEGKRLFSSSEDRKALSLKSASALDKVFDVARKLNCLSDKDKEVIEKNLE